MADRLLIVEDNRDILASVVDYLEIKGFEVDAIENGQAARALIQAHPYDLVVLDIGLPGMDGFTLCKELRERDRNPLPVIMLTARDAVEDRLLGFEAGADDYLVKPFALPELHQRIKAVLKRSQRNFERVLRVGELSLDTASRQVHRSAQPIKLDRKGFALLELLMKQWPDVVSHEDLNHALWGDEPPDSAALKSHIYRLRQAVDGPFDSPMIRNVAGTGYTLVTDAQ
ncbi:MAG: DNA-binding response regulator [Haliea sp.]|uniref:response regulator transcription factor n=1 Tax=Haliea sp. TaxID=1932666 RepID=UPI000C408C05|nr:response regulator transcription factor [Haliea sp.]MBM68958.1 DNA-binding response regulator [Haliea sp.]|tara:strand:+ start:9988 stop:10671 length:684 start_codon:yes stop_codon:yes gene_type:complete